jgi:PAS domain S-box-containing protein
VAVRAAPSKADVGRQRGQSEAPLLDTHLSALLEIAPDAMLIVNRDGRILLVNAQAERLFGYSRAELVGEPLELLVPERFHSEHQAHSSAYFEAPRAREMGAGPELFARRKDGTEFPAEISLSILDTEAGKLATAAVRDTTERRRIEGRFRELQAKVLGYEGMLSEIDSQKAAEGERERQLHALVQAEKVAAMGSLLAGVAHELNNPLAVVMGQASLLERAAAGGPLAARAAKISAAAERCARIVTNFLALARQRPPERHPIDLATVIRDALELLAYSLRTDSIDVETKIAADLPLLWGDGHQLQQVIVNLVTNARQAMRGQPGPRLLLISAQPSAGRSRVVVEVTDTGPGIPAEVQDRLFEPFFTTKPVGEGSGLGLSLCRGIVESHGGTIDASCGDGHGACFRIELPVGDAPATTDAAPRGAAPLDKRRILVVDDETAVAGVVAEMLANHGCIVDVRETAAEALDALARTHYDLVLSDVKMPEMDGPAFFREATQRDASLARRFVFVTGDSLSADVAGFLRASGLFSLEKPFRETDLLAAIRAALGG